jgi:hypothetical protein
MVNRKLMRRLGLVALLALASTGGCALVIGADFGDKTVRGSGGGGSSTSSTSTGGSGGSTVDAGPDVAPDAPDDGSNDDAPPDAPPPDGGPSPCSTAHTFCDDFDAEDNTFAAWFGVDAPPDTTTETLAIDSSIQVSGTSSLHARLTQQQDAHFALNQLFGGSSKNFHCELDIRHDSLPGDAQAPILKIDVPGNFYVSLSLGTNNALGACVYAGPCSIVAFAGPAPGVWAHFVIDVDLENGGTKLALGKVGTEPFQVGTAGSAAVPGYSGGLQLAIGILSKYTPTGPFDVHFDNVWCDVTP